MNLIHHVYINCDPNSDRPLNWTRTQCSEFIDGDTIIVGVDAVTCEDCKTALVDTALWAAQL